ncbi:hypothetical protein B0H14DRAFT_2577121 [Mycena olivaceomarginata]|nr:hypothetical protein B0H14DRAFT_2577121 [Mycena olivaceomarginata]
MYEVALLMTRRLAWTSCATVAWVLLEYGASSTLNLMRHSRLHVRILPFWANAGGSDPSFLPLPAASMDDDDAQLLASVAAGDLLAFRASRFLSNWRRLRLLSHASRGTARQNRGSWPAAGDIPLLEASSSGRVLSPRRTARTETSSFVSVASTASDECSITQVAAVTPAVPIANPPAPPPAPPPVDLAPPADFCNDLSWLDNFGFMADISRPLDAFLDDGLLGNTVANPAAGHADFLFDGNSDFNWLSASLLNDGGDFCVPSAPYDFEDSNGGEAGYLDPSFFQGSDGLAFDASSNVVPSTGYELPLLPLPPASSPYPSPAAPKVNAPSPIEALNADVDERNIFHSARTRHTPKRVLES